jgi:hypothetical protein
LEVHQLLLVEVTRKINPAEVSATKGEETKTLEKHPVNSSRKESAPSETTVGFHMKVPANRVGEVADSAVPQTTPALTEPVVTRNSSLPACSAGKREETGTLDKRHVNSFNKEHAGMEIIAVSHTT